MENRTPFNLNEAIRRWQQDLAASPALSADNVEELASHLRASVQSLQADGLSEEESFLAATQRLGEHGALEREFGKAAAVKATSHTMAESERQAWGQKRAQGRDRFILRGILRRAGLFPGIFTVFLFLSDLLRHNIESPLLELGTLLCLFGVATLGGGWLEGEKIWYRREKEFKDFRGGDHVA
jgi:hypothetical protein